MSIFALEFLMKLKLPLLHRHFKTIDLKLDVVVSPWFLTVFIHLHGQQNVPMDTIAQIWDYFIINGWSSLLSVSLSFLYLSQEYVLRENLEKTIELYTTQLPHKDLFKTISKFEVEQPLLDDLQKAYYLQS